MYTLRCQKGRPSSDTSCGRRPPSPSKKAKRVAAAPKHAAHLADRQVGVGDQLAEHDAPRRRRVGPRVARVLDEHRREVVELLLLGARERGRAERRDDRLVTRVALAVVVVGGGAVLRRDAAVGRRERRRGRQQKLRWRRHERHGRAQELGARVDRAQRPRPIQGEHCQRPTKEDRRKC